jgi:hypothetical protein
MGLCIFFSPEINAQTGSSNISQEDIGRLSIEHYLDTLKNLQNISWDSSFKISYDKEYVARNIEPFTSDIESQYGKIKLIFNRTGYAWEVQRYKSTGDLMFHRIAQFSANEYQEYDFTTHLLVVSKKPPVLVPISYLFQNTLFMPLGIVDSNPDYQLESFFDPMEIKSADFSRKLLSLKFAFLGAHGDIVSFRVDKGAIYDQFDVSTKENNAIVKFSRFKSDSKSKISECTFSQFQDFKVGNNTFHLPTKSTFDLFLPDGTKKRSDVDEISNFVFNDPQYEDLNLIDPFMAESIFDNDAKMNITIPK